MKPTDYEIAKELKKRVSYIARVIDFRIFGSRVRGDADEDSDMDIFIEVESMTKELKKKIYNIVWEVGFENFVFISPLIFTKEEIEQSPMKASPIVKSISEDGVPV